METANLITTMTAKTFCVSPSTRFTCAGTGVTWPCSGGGPKGKFIDHEWDKDGPKFPMGLSGHNYQTGKEALTYYLKQMKANCDNKC